MDDSEAENNNDEMNEQNESVNESKYAAFRMETKEAENARIQVVSILSLGSV